MCGRFTQHWTWDELRRAAEPFWDVPDFERDPPARYNLAPTQAAEVIRAPGGASSPAGLMIGPVRWGFRRPDGGEVINARSETATTMPMFRDAAASRRCLVPASGFYEWEALGHGPKQPWYLSPCTEGGGAGVFFLAGLWSPGPDGDRFVTLTAATPEGFEPAIHHRMPLVVAPEHARAWLHQPDDAGHADHAHRSHGPLGAAGAMRLAAPFGAPGTFGFNARPVSTRVNATANEGPGLLDRVEPEPGLFG